MVNVLVMYMATCSMVTAGFRLMNKALTISVGIIAL